MYKIANHSRLFFETLRHKNLSDKDIENINKNNQKLIQELNSLIIKGKSERALRIFIKYGKDIPRNNELLDILLKINTKKINNNHLKLILNAQIISTKFCCEDYNYVIDNTNSFFEKFKNLLNFSYQEISGRLVTFLIESYINTNQHEVAKITIDELLNKDISLFAKGSLYLQKYEIYNDVLFLELAYNMYLQAGFKSNAFFALIQYAHETALLDFEKSKIIETKIEEMIPDLEIENYWSLAVFYFSRAIQYKYIEEYEISLEYTLKVIRSIGNIKIKEFINLCQQSAGLICELTTYLKYSREELKEKYGIEINNINTDNEINMTDNKNEHFEITKNICIEKQFDMFRKLEEKYKNNEEYLSFLYLRYAEHNFELPLKERISYLDKVLNIQKNIKFNEYQLSHVYKVYAEVFLQNDNIEKYIEYGEKYTDLTCYDKNFNKNFVNILVKNNLWNKLEQFSLKYQKKFKKNIYSQYLYAKSLYFQEKSQDDLNKSLTILVSIEDQIEYQYKEDILSMKKDLLQRNCRTNYTIENKDENRIITIDIFEKALDEFIEYIQSKCRMDYWQYDKETKTYNWIQCPENRAKHDLQLFLNTKFGKNILLFDEIPSGAGFIDLYIIFNSGLEIIIELKMCGGGYSTQYALSGEKQLFHYLKNRNSKFGYLVIFDGRKRDYGKKLVVPQNDSKYDIYIKTIDMRTSTKDN